MYLYRLFLLYSIIMIDVIMGNFYYKCEYKYNIFYKIKKIIKFFKGIYNNCVPHRKGSRGVCGPRAACLRPLI